MYRIITVLTVVMMLSSCAAHTSASATPQLSATVSTPSAAASSPAPAPPSSPAAPPTSSQPPYTPPSFQPAAAKESNDQVAIREGWVKYWHVLEKFASNPRGYTDFTETQHVTTGEEANEILNTIQSLREKNWRSGGGIRFVDIVVGAPSTAGDARSAVITYCVDGTHLVVYDENGKPLQRRSRSFRETSTLVEGKDNVWRVAMIRNQEVESCYN